MKVTIGSAVSISLVKGPNSTLNEYGGQDEEDMFSINIINLNKQFNGFCHGEDAK